MRLLLQLLLAAALATGVTAPGEAAAPRWDPAHPDQNPGARPLNALSREPTAGEPADQAAAEDAPLFDLFVGRSAVAKGIGLLVRGNVPRGTVLLNNALRVGRPSVSDTAHLLDFRALSSINHCWVPNARLLRRVATSASPNADVVYDLVAISDIDGEGMPSEVMIDYSATVGLIEMPRTSWTCTNPSPPTRTKPSPPGGGIKYELDKHYTPWLPKELTTGDRELFKRWHSGAAKRETLVHCMSSGPDAMPGIPTSGKLPHCKGGFLSSAWQQQQPDPQGQRSKATLSPGGGSDGVATATALFFRNTEGEATSPDGTFGKHQSKHNSNFIKRRKGDDPHPPGAETSVAAGQLYLGPSAIQGVGLFCKEAVAAGAIILPLAIEAASRGNGDRQLSIYEFASHVNHCWAGNTYLRSVIADVDVDGGFGAYYRFALVATEDIAAGTELVADYRLAPWFIAQAPRRWKCPNVDRADDVVSSPELFQPLPWERV